MGSDQTRSSAGPGTKLEQQPQFFQSLLEITPVAIITTDLDANVTSWNPAAEELFGYAVDEAVGHEIDELIANRDDLHDEAEAFRSESARSGRFHGISRRVRKDGTLVDVEINAVAVHIGGEHVG
jgi:PAS domain S-box-containing protein